MGVLTTQTNTQHRAMSGVTWRDIPITRININMKEQEQTRKQPGKRVTWNENLLDIKTISPQLQKVVLHAVKQFPNQRENRTYEWTPQRNTNNQRYHNSQLQGTFV